MILLIDTSAAYCSVAISDAQGNILIEENSEIKNSHAEALPGMIANCLQQLPGGKSDLQAVCLSRGPGSYTGLRIGTSLAKGLCFGLEIPLLSVNTLQAMAHFAAQKEPNAEIIISMLDARRQEVFCLVADQKENILEETHALVLDENAFAKYGDNQILCVGNANEKTREIVPGLKGAGFLDTHPRAAFMGIYAADKFKNSAFEDLAYFVPFYLKDFIPGISKKGGL